MTNFSKYDVYVTVDEHTEAIDHCTLQWDKRRGVLYVHALDGHTILRVCRLPQPKYTTKSLLSKGRIDITHMFGASLPGEKNEYSRTSTFTKPQIRY